MKYGRLFAFSTSKFPARKLEGGCSGPGSATLVTNPSSLDNGRVRGLFLGEASVFFLILIALKKLASEGGETGGSGEQNFCDGVFDLVSTDARFETQFIVLSRVTTVSFVWVGLASKSFSVMLGTLGGKTLMLFVLEVLAGLVLVIEDTLVVGSLGRDKLGFCAREVPNISDLLGLVMFISISPKRLVSFE